MFGSTKRIEQLHNEMYVRLDKTLAELEAWCPGREPEPVLRFSVIPDALKRQAGDARELAEQIAQVAPGQQVVGTLDAYAGYLDECSGQVGSFPGAVYPTWLRTEVVALADESEKLRMMHMSSQLTALEIYPRSLTGEPFAQRIETAENALERWRAACMTATVDGVPIHNQEAGLARALESAGENGIEVLGRYRHSEMENRLQIASNEAGLNMLPPLSVPPEATAFAHKQLPGQPVTSSEFWASLDDPANVPAPSSTGIELD